MNCQMIRVISSPSISTTGFCTLILGMPPTSLRYLRLARGRVSATALLPGRPGGPGGLASPVGPVTTVSAARDRRPAGRWPARPAPSRQRCAAWRPASPPAALAAPAWPARRRTARPPVPRYPPGRTAGPARSTPPRPARRPALCHREAAIPWRPCAFSPGQSQDAGLGPRRRVRLARRRPRLTGRSPGPALRAQPPLCPPLRASPLDQWRPGEVPITDVLTVRPYQPIVCVLLHDMGRPAGHPADREDRGEQVGRDAEVVVDAGGVEVHVRVQALLGEDRTPHLARHPVVRVVTGCLRQFRGQLTQVGGTRVLGLVDTVPEAHDLLARAAAPG